jgi:hypothetical protein
MAQNDPFDEVARAIARNTETWDKDKEPSLYGRVLELGGIETEYGQSATVTLLTADDCEVLVLGFGAVLNRAFKFLPINPGDLLGIRYLGKRKARNGKDYPDYKIVLRNPDGSPKNRRTTATSDVPPPPDFDDYDDGDTF